MSWIVTLAVNIQLFFLVFLFLLSPFSFKLYDSEAFSIFPDFYNYYQYLNLKYFHRPKKLCLGLRIYVVLFSECLISVSGVIDSTSNI